MVGGGGRPQWSIPILCRVAPSLALLPSLAQGCADVMSSADVQSLVLLARPRLGHTVLYSTLSTVQIQVGTCDRARCMLNACIVHV